METLPVTFPILETPANHVTVSAIGKRREPPPSMSQQNWQTNVLPGLINIQLLMHSEEWLGSDEMDAGMALYLNNLPHVVREPSFACHLSEQFDRFSDRLSPMIVDGVLRGAEVVVIGGNRGRAELAHWYLMVVAVKAQRIFVIDSLPGKQADLAHGRAILHLQKLWREQITSADPNISYPTRVLRTKMGAQTDGWTCGYHVVKIVMMMFRLPLTFVRAGSKIPGVTEAAWELMEDNLRSVTRWAVPLDWEGGQDAPRSAKPQRQKTAPRRGKSATRARAPEPKPEPKTPKSRRQQDPQASSQPIRRSRRLNPDLVPEREETKDEPAPVDAPQPPAPRRRQRPKANSQPVRRSRRLNPDMIPEEDENQEAPGPLDAPKTPGQDLAGEMKKLEVDKEATPKGNRASRERSVGEDPEREKNKNAKKHDVNPDDIRSFLPRDRVEDIIPLDYPNFRNVRDRAYQMMEGQVETPFRWNETWRQAARRFAPRAPALWEGWSLYKANVAELEAVNAEAPTPRPERQRHGKGPLVLMDERGRVIT
ncbi:hypothetical protein F4861DRAFT_276398, partial [Xylaria intraflava]